MACLGDMVAGFVAVWHYANTYELTVPGGHGAGMGALAALVSGIVYSLLTWLFRATGIQPSQMEQQQQMMEWFGMDPAQTEQMAQAAPSPGMMMVYLVIGLLVGAIVGAVGGAVGAAVFKKGERPLGSSPDVI